VSDSPHSQNLGALSQEQHALAQTHLRPDERLLWLGKPDARRMARNYIVPGWGAALVIAVVLALIGVDLLLLALFVPVLFVIMLLLGLLWIYPDARRTVYALTNQRVLVLNTGQPDMPQELAGSDLGVLRCFEQSDGTGDLFFASAEYQRTRRRGTTRHFGFIGIPQVRDVEQQMQAVFPQCRDDEE
jgi:hypothetical protein